LSASAGQDALQAAYHSLDQDVPREKGDARLVQIEGFDPEEVATLNVETCLEKLGLKNGPPVIPRSWRDVEPNHHSPILRAVTENAVTTLTLAGNACSWHFCDTPTASSDVRFQEKSGRHLLVLSILHFDPERTLAQGEPTSTSVCSGEVDAGSPSRTYAILG
jgi:hypothetical protein